MIGALEGLLFVVGEDGLTINRMSEILELEENQINDLLVKLSNKYENEDCGISLTKYGEYYKLTTKKEHKKYYEALINTEDDSLLSQASLETLAIVAYNQPVTRMMVDEIRGINSSHMIRRLVSKNLIKECGRADTPGKPILYSVTDDFLDYFGLNSISDLPKIEEISVDEKELDLYESKYIEK